jgi:beta-lactamase class A
MLRATAAVLILAATATAPSNDDLAQRARSIAEPLGGRVGFAVMHIESGATTSVDGDAALPLFSVFKLPVAVVALQEVAAGRLRLDRQVHVTPAESSGGSASNVSRWSKPVDVSVRELIRLAIVYSDNTSVDKLLEILGGPEKVERAVAHAGFPGIKIKSTVRGSGKFASFPNVAGANELVRLLAALQKGELLKPAERDLLLGFMRDAVTGLQRIRGALPEGTAVGDKTGTGPTTTNDVGIITLPGDRGHLAIAVLITDSKRPVDAQEKAIADLARAAYDSYAKR